MAYYAASILTGATPAGTAHAVLRTGANRINLRFIEFFAGAATANFVGVGYKGAGTTTPSTSTLGTPLDIAMGASLENVDSAWSAGPGTPTTWIKRVYIAASVGTGVIFTWQKDAPLVIAASSSLAIFNFGGSAGGISAINIEWES